MTRTARELLNDLTYEIGLGTLEGRRADLIESYDKFHKDKGFLTPAQRNVLEKIHKEFMG